MQFDLDEEGANPGALPRFQVAGAQSQRLLAISTCLAVLGIAALIAAARLPPLPWRTLLANGAAALLMLAAALESGYAVARWRCQAIGTEGRPRWARWRLSHLAAPAATETAAAAGESVARALWRRAGRSLHRMRRFGERLVRQIGADVVEAFWVGGLAILAIVAVRIGWKLDLVAADLGRVGNVAGAAALAVSFILLVLDRYLASMPAAEWPEATRLAQLTRVAIATALLLAVALFYAAPERVWPLRLAVLAGVLPAAVAFELLLRAFGSLFVKRSVTIEPRLLADSLLAGFFQWPIRPIRILQDELQARYGINLKQNWAFSFIRRRSLPVLGAVLVVAWLFSGFHELATDRRGVYERFGRPVRVLGPGLHYGLPWPLAKVIAVENGVIHQLATSPEEEGGAEAVDTSSADGPAPESANRLWDASHEAENGQVIAGLTNDKQSFQVVNMDVRLVYRIALTDAAALAVTYNVADVPALIRSTANRILVQDFASRTLDGLLGEGRLQLASDIGSAVQRELTRLDSGVELLATVLEQIHPPAGAANAYHSVQAAQIIAGTSVTRERGNAAQQLNDAQLNGTLAQDKATAAAREAIATANAANIRFAAEQKAYRTAGRAFLQEQYYSQLSKGLSNGSLLILDHRIGSSVSPTIDLRTLALPAEN